jgi:Rod binding domain-containing protein
MTTTLLSNVDPNSLSRLTKTGTPQQRAEKVVGQFEGMLVREILKSAKPPSLLPAKSGEAKLVGEVYSRATGIDNRPLQTIGAPDWR